MIAPVRSGERGEGGGEKMEQKRMRRRNERERERERERDRQTQTDGWIEVAKEERVGENTCTLTSVYVFKWSKNHLKRRLFVNRFIKVIHCTYLRQCFLEVASASASPFLSKSSVTDAAFSTTGRSHDNKASNRNSAHCL